MLQRRAALLHGQLDASHTKHNKAQAADEEEKRGYRFVFRFNMEISLLSYDFFEVMVCNQLYYWAITIPNKIREMP